MLRKMKKDELNHELDKMQRKLGAYFEWTQSVCHNEPSTLMVVIPDQLHVRLRRLSRAAGGVVVVHTVHMGWYDEPEYLDSLCARWMHDGSHELREAAKQMQGIRDREVLAWNG